MREILKRTNPNARWRTKVSKRREGQLYFRQRRFRGCYAPARLHRVPYPLSTAKCLRSSYHSVPRRVARETHSAIPTSENPSRRSLNHTLFVPRRPRNTQSAQEKGVHRARNPPCLVLTSLKISASRQPLVCNRSFASTITRSQDHFTGNISRRHSCLFTDPNLSYCSICSICTGSCSVFTISRMQK